MSIASKSLTLNTGQKIPVIGLGTWQSSESEVYDAVIAALKVGYRHIDTAWIYGNEAPVGKAIKDSGVPREDIFVTTKLFSLHHRDPVSALRTSLTNLGLDYVDLYLMHWPVALNPNGKDNFPLLPNGNRDLDIKDWDFTKTWGLMEELPQTGLTKAVGVSNFTISKLKTLLAMPNLKLKPATNQVELHPYLPQPKLVQYCKDNGIVVQAYSPLGSTNSPLFSDEKVKAIAAKYGVSAANIMISWAIYRDTVVLPKSVTPLRIADNFKVVDLAPEDAEVIDGFSAGNKKRFTNPNWAPFDVFDESD